MVDPPELLLKPPWVFVWPVVTLLLTCACALCCCRLRESHTRVLQQAQTITHTLVSSVHDSDSLELQQVRTGIDGRLR